MFKEWLKKYKKSIIVIFVCLLIIGAVITATILTRPNDDTDNSNDADVSENALIADCAAFRWIE